MALPALYGIVVLIQYGVTSWRAAAFAKAMWQAVAVMRVHSASISAVRVLGAIEKQRIIQLTFRGADFTIKALKNGQVTVKALSGGEVPAALVKELGVVLSRAEGFQGLYGGARASAVAKPAFEMLFKAGG
jgi:hypothetical protein